VIQSQNGAPLGRIRICHGDPVRGIATSGRHGRSLSLGIADSVTVLATSGARADVAATLIANAVDLPDHPGVTRRPARELDPDSDLGDMHVVTACAPLEARARNTALKHGLALANRLTSQGQIIAAALYLQGETMVTPTLNALTKDPAHV
jgi:ApbE superfamily uncharacterized protein (UPF0280 family)